MALQNLLGDLALDASVVQVYEALLQGRDIFGNTVVGTRHNAVEVHWDDANWANYVTQDKTGGAQGGSATPGPGYVEFRSGTSANGSIVIETLDTALYHGGVESYGCGTHVFLTAPTGPNDRYLYYPLAVRAAGVVKDGVGIGWMARPGGAVEFGIRYVRNSVEVLWVPRAMWDDPVDGTVGSAYTSGGAPVNCDFTAGGKVIEVRAGLYGYFGFEVRVYSPDKVWVPIWHHFGLDDNDPVFSNYDLKSVLEIVKGAGSNAVSFGGRAGCWAAGRMTDADRLTEPFTDRSIVRSTRSVIFGKAPNGSRVEVTVNSQGRLQVTNDSVGTDGAAAPAGVTAIGGVDPATGLLQTAQADSAGRLANVDRFIGGEVLADQTGTGAVLTFTFAAPVDLIWARLDGTGNGRADPFGGTPDAATGIVLEPGVPVPMTVTKSSLKVWAPAGTTVQAYGYRY